MKQAKGIFAALAAFGVMYLMGVFCTVSFDISEWTEAWRVAIALLGGCCAVYAYAVITH